MKNENPQPTILIVESDIMIAQLLIASLKDKYEVHHISEGYDFCQQIKDHDYDLIICNMILSFYGGVELLNTLRHQLLKNTPFILLSFTENRLLSQIPQSDPKCDYLVRPFSIEALQVKTQKALLINQNLTFS
ncbi:response regulator receiver (plasmid) [Emticicia oligotrophica DSM 17448]|uniref:Response regulator receiver n=1 Tax=Emticicia oligotrophica (strain DSM 17448 / CIP 109782 / MTCC 6937 / GPTSA100-15) TaxID=929562 RepID=A0ABM5N887_EMTOG|nr:response regulator [Emticicia oligotrophica]AFK05754.1 response regulator receiver [Emticicia oligotrophica DSM 17448]